MVAANWLQLRVLGESNIVKLTILFPVLGWLLAYDEGVANYLFNKGFYDSIGEAYAAPSSFYFMYFGLLLIGVASIIYQIFCPALAKENRSENDYIEKFMLHKNSGRVESFLVGIQIFGSID